MPQLRSGRLLTTIGWVALVIRIECIALLFTEGAPTHTHPLSLSLQFHIVSNSSILFTRAVLLNEAPGTNVTHLLPSNDGEHVFAMTPSKVCDQQLSNLL